VPELVPSIQGGAPDDVAGNAVDVDPAAAAEQKSVRGIVPETRIWDVVSQDGIVAMREQMNAAISEILDLQALDGTVSARDEQTFARSGCAAVQHNGKVGVVERIRRVRRPTGFGSAVDEHGRGDGIEWASGLDGEWPCAGDGEHDFIDAGLVIIGV